LRYVQSSEKRSFPQKNLSIYDRDGACLLEAMHWIFTRNSV